MIRLYDLRAGAIAVAFLSLGALTACGGGSSSSVPAAPPAAPVAVSGVDGTAESLSALSNANDVASALSIADSLDAGRVQSSSVRNVAAANPCVSASPQPPVDANGNGIPDNETYTLTNCTRPGWYGSTETFNGVFNITDTSQSGNTTWTRTVTNMNVAVSGGTGGSFSEVRNGTGNHTLNSPSQETIVRNFTIARTGSSGTAANITLAETVVFNAAGGATIVPLKAPPSGTITVSGTRAVSSGSQSVTYTVATPTALSYDSTCQTPPRIVAGVLTLTPQTGNPITLTFTGCGTPPTKS